jgi:hypothetical protein
MKQSHKLTLMLLVLASLRHQAAAELVAYGRGKVG